MIGGNLRNIINITVLSNTTTQIIPLSVVNPSLINYMLENAVVS